MISIFTTLGFGGLRYRALRALNYCTIGACGPYSKGLYNRPKGLTPKGPRAP